MGTTKMPTPVRRPTSQFYWIRKKVPERLRPLVGRSEVWKSLETSDKRKAVAKCAAVSAELEAHWAQLVAVAQDLVESNANIPPVPLTHQDLVALRGEVHVRLSNRSKLVPFHSALCDLDSPGVG